MHVQFGHFFVAKKFHCEESYVYYCHEVVRVNVHGAETQDFKDSNSETSQLSPEVGRRWLRRTV